MSNCKKDCKFYFFPIEIAVQFEALAKKHGVSKVARGEVASTQTDGGFFQHAKRVNGSVEKLFKMPIKKGSDQTWWRRRNNFCARHRAQRLKQNEPVVESLDEYKGTPTRRELGMIMWMCSNLSVKELEAMLPKVKQVSE